MQELPNLTTLSHPEKDALIHALWELVRDLRREVVELKAEVASLKTEVSELRGKASKNSRNSSKPPASDGYAKPPPKSQRTPSGLKPGGQPGHKGTTLEQTEHPDETVIHALPETCDACGAKLDPAAIEVLTESRQVFDLPPMKHIVTAHLITQGSSAHPFAPCMGATRAGVCAGRDAPHDRLSDL